MIERRVLWGWLCGAVSVIVAGLGTWAYLTWLIVPDDGLEALMFLPLLGGLTAMATAVLGYGRSADDATRAGLAVFGGAVVGAVAVTFALGATAGAPVLVGPGTGYAVAQITAPCCLVGGAVGVLTAKLVRRARMTNWGR